ncbi:MAG: hypothetical protein P1Q69_04940 [Candidatus Thorarchaeota archaeon]|nr:hypothetical protein [Candidatus Thorarchaeota archaeon]
MREDSLRPSCRACDTNHATHFCEDCGATLCADCLETRTSQYTVCNECHHNLGIPIPGESFEQCPACESDNLGKGRRVEEICPQCHSTLIISIQEKKRGLAQELRQAIMSIHYGHTRLREFNNTLLSSKRLLVSLRMANFLHYNWLEDKIEEIQSEVVALKNRVINQAEIIAKKITAETKGLMDYTHWTTPQFPFIEGITNRVTQMGNQYKVGVDESLKDAKRKLEDVKHHLDGLDYYRRKFAGFYDTADLSVNELPVCALPDIRVTGSDFLKHDKASGTFYITNKRLVFIAEVGIVRKKNEIIFDFPLLYLNSIEEDGRIRKRLVLKLKQGELKIACSEQTQKVLPDYVEIARRFDRYMQTDLQRVRKLEQVNLNVSDVRMKIEGLVYSLLSPGPEPQSDGYYPRTHPHTRQDWRTHGREPYPQTESRYSPSHDNGRVNPRDSRYNYPKRTDFLTPSMGNVPQNRDVMEIDRALNESVELLRMGRIVPEDFIRRYRGLMRDSYTARKQTDRQSKPSGTPRW